MRTVAIISLVFLLSGCLNKRDDHNHAVSAPTEKYTCPMHPQIIAEKPGVCPICGMDLVKINTSQDLMLSDNQLKLANIKTMVARSGTYEGGTYVTGTLRADQRKSDVVASRVGGRIEKLFVKETGKMIIKGQPLYTLYSESLITLQQEYLLAKEQYETLGKSAPHFKSILEAAKEKLMLTGLSIKQIEQLKDRTALKPDITFLAPASGYVSEVGVAEGQYVQEGTILYRLDDINNLWVEAEMYPHEAAKVKPGDKLMVNFDSDKNEVEAIISFISPELNVGSQTVIVRAELKNNSLVYRPGENVQVYFKKTSNVSITLPADAVIRDSNGSHVYLKRRAGTFTPTKVITGNETADEVEIKEGVAVGDTIVVSGAYLLYSELVLKKGFKTKDLN